MRILLTTDTVGNAWSFTRSLSEELLYRGHQIALVSFGRRPSHEQQVWVTTQTCAYGKAFHFVASNAPLEWMEDNEFVLQQGEGLLHHTVREFEADILHSSQFCYGALTLDIPKVITAHTDLYSWVEGCRGCKPQSTRWLRHYKALVTSGLNHADAVVSPTRWMATSLARQFSMLPASYVVRHGRALASAPEPHVRTLQAVTNGRLWDETKNILMLQDVVSPIPIYVAGERKHQDEISPRQLGKAVLLGGQPEPLLLSLYERSTIYIDTSTYDPTGLDALKAALCGCAVVANDIPAIREMWGDAALYFRGARGLSSILQRLNRNGEELAEMQRRAHFCAAGMSPQRMADGYETIYQSLAARPLTAGVAAEGQYTSAHAA